MKNIIECPNCSAENPYTAYTCNSCHYFIRDKVANINLWSLFWEMMESPRKAFNNILFSEHKNFLVIVLIILSLKSFINSMVFNTALAVNPDVFSSFGNNLWLAPLYFLTYILLSAFILNFINKISGIESKFFNSLSILTFSLWPLLFVFTFFTVIEYALFGQYFFTFTPSPLDIKPTATYFIWGLEGFFMLVSMVYVMMGINIQTNSKLYACLFGLLFAGGIIALQIFAPLFPFS